MAKKQDVFKCEMCGHMTEVLHQGGGTMICCNKPMTAIGENTTDAAQEKHVPVIEKIEGGYKVAVGSISHPMTADHLIEWIELIAGDKVYLKYPAPGEAPEVVFNIDAAKVTARAYCNLHGLWKSEV
ncbi:MAG: desulfoferrodoxin [bacterium]|nr:desulfoferrodoxin [bacterium]